MDRPVVFPPDAAVLDTAPRSRSLVAACLAHALHDGYTDALYVFLPVWQTRFGLSYAALAVVRALYYATMGGLQLPADRVLRRMPAGAALIASVVIAATGLAIAALPFGFVGLCIGLVVAGIGSSIQHPRASQLVADQYGSASRRPLAAYNFAGDLGKAILPAAAAPLLTFWPWRPVLLLLAGIGVVVAVALAALIGPGRPPAPPTLAAAGRGRGGFGLLVAIGALDTATRMGYLLFLPFLIHARHGGQPIVGLALAVLFVGGAFGKAVCGFLAERLGVVGSVVATEAATALLIGATLATPLVPLLLLLPLLGIVLNGTSSVLYGTVPELSAGDTGRAFAVFYTSVIGSGGLAPILYGVIADHGGRTVGALAAAATALSILPLALALRPHLRAISRIPPKEPAAP